MPAVVTARRQVPAAAGRGHGPRCRRSARPPTAAGPAPGAGGTRSGAASGRGAAGRRSLPAPVRPAGAPRRRTAWSRRGWPRLRCPVPSRSRPARACSDPARSGGPRPPAVPRAGSAWPACLSLSLGPPSISRTSPLTAVACRSYLLGDLAGPGEHEAHRLVPQIGRRVEHQRATTIDHGDPVLAAVFGGRVRDASRPERAMHPHLLDAEIRALPHSRLGSCRRRSDDHGLDTARDRLQVVVATIAFDLVGVRVDREHLVATIPQPLVHDVAAVILRRPGYASHRDALVGQELRRGLFHREHDCLLCAGRARTASQPSSPHAAPTDATGPGTNVTRLGPIRPLRTIGDHPRPARAARYEESPSSRAARTAAWVRRSRPSLASRLET